MDAWVRCVGRGVVGHITTDVGRFIQSPIRFVGEYWILVYAKFSIAPLSVKVDMRKGDFGLFDAFCA